MQALCQTAAVTISREGQFFLVEPPCEDLLGPVLQTRVCQSHVGLDGALSVKRRRTPLYEIAKNWAGAPVLKFWAGLDEAVFTILRGAQVKVQRRGGVRHVSLPLPAWNKQLPDRPFLEHIAQHDRGLIRCNAGAFAPAHLIAQVARAWPDLNITVVCARRDDVINLAKQLRAAKVDAFGFTARNQPRVKACVAVCTFAGMAYNPTEIEKQNIIIVLDAVAGTSKEHRQFLEYAVRARLFGLLDLARPLSRYEEDLVRCVFGFEEAVIVRHGYRLRPVETALSRSQGRRLKQEPENDFERKRHGLWRNDARNRQIARVAKACASGDGTALQGLVLDPLSPTAVIGAPGTFVIVENIEHAAYLLPKLPGWPVLTNGAVNLDGLADEQRAAIKERRLLADPKMRFGIVTHLGMQHQTMPWDQVDVLVRADSGVDLPELPLAGLVQPTTDESIRTLLVIDFDDVHDPELLRRGEKRRNAYYSAGWLPHGVDPMLGRVYQFLQVRRRRQGKAGRS